MEKEYLSVEEQFKEILNDEEISRIEDYELREIRSRYWAKRRDVFLDEHGVPDDKLAGVTDELIKAEQREIAKYRKRHNI